MPATTTSVLSLSAKSDKKQKIGRREYHTQGWKRSTLRYLSHNLYAHKKKNKASGRQCMNIKYDFSPLPPRPSWGCNSGGVGSVACILQRVGGGVAAFCMEISFWETYETFPPPGKKGIFPCCVSGKLIFSPLHKKLSSPFPLIYLSRLGSFP